MKKLKVLLFVIGLIIVLGSIGSCAIEVVSFGKAARMCLIGLPMMCFGVVGL